MACQRECGPTPPAPTPMSVQLVPPLALWKAPPAWPSAPTNTLLALLGSTAMVLLYQPMRPMMLGRFAVVVVQFGSGVQPGSQLTVSFSTVRSVPGRVVEG